MAKGDNSVICREKALKDSFDQFWSGIFKDGTINAGDSLYEQMSLRDFVGLKKAVSDINNIITLKVTQAFIQMLASKGILSDDERAVALADVDKVNANTNGYDVQIITAQGITLIAEIKCNIPVLGDSFGAAQRRTIIKDIEQLANPSMKTKSKLSESDTLLKFMVMLDYEGVREASKRVIRELTGKGIPISDEDEINWETLSSEVVNMVYIPIG